MCKKIDHKHYCIKEQVEVLLSQFEWKSRDSPTETRLTDRYRSTDSLSFVTPANFLRAVTVRRMANESITGVFSPVQVLESIQLMRMFCCYGQRQRQQYTLSRTVWLSSNYSRSSSVCVCVCVCVRACVFTFCSLSIPHTDVSNSQWLFLTWNCLSIVSV